MYWICNLESSLFSLIRTWIAHSQYMPHKGIGIFMNCYCQVPHCQNFIKKNSRNLPSKYLFTKFTYIGLPTLVISYRIFTRLDSIPRFQKPKGVFGNGQRWGFFGHLLGFCAVVFNIPLPMGSMGWVYIYLHWYHKNQPNVWQIYQCHGSVKGYLNASGWIFVWFETHNIMGI